MTVKEIKRKFRSSIQRGTGEAVLIMQSYPGVDFSKEIAQASIKNYCYDSQCENSRGEYLSRLIDLSSKSIWIIAEIMSALSVAVSDSWDTEQLMRLARIFAQKGNAEAKKMLLKKFAEFSRKPEFSYSDTYAEELIALDGLDGLKYAASELGKRLIKDNELWEDDTLISIAKEIVPNSDPEGYLKHYAVKDRYIKTYLERINKTPAWRKEYWAKRAQKKNNLSPYEQTKLLINEQKTFSGRRLKGLSHEDISNLADEFLKETNKRRIVGYLRVFSSFTFPLSYKFIIEKSDRLSRSDNYWSVKALSIIKDDRLRQYTLQKLKTAKYPHDYLPLLILNFKLNDNKLIYSILSRVKNVHDFHAAANDAIEIYKNNKTKACLSPMLEVYNRTKCGFCRSEAIEIMIESSVLPKNIKLEIPYDSHYGQEN